MEHLKESDKTKRFLIGGIVFWWILLGLYFLLGGIVPIVENKAWMHLLEGLAQTIAVYGLFGIPLMMMLALILKACQEQFDKWK